MNWKEFAIAAVVFNLIGVLVVYLFQRIQYWLPLNPQNLANISPLQALNTAISFATNTNWQSSAGETDASYLIRILALTVQNFFSAATGVAVVLAFIRGLTQATSRFLGNFWLDITRAILYIFLPLSFLLAILLMSQGVIQNFNPNKTATTQENQTQIITLGPVASGEAIKELGTNGGGFFNANSAHPFENPTPLSNLLEMLALLLIPAALCCTFGYWVNDKRQGWTILVTMTLIFIVMVSVTLYAEQAGNPILTAAGANQTASPWQSGGNMEGKETRFGITDSALFATVTTATSGGAVNAMHDSFTPLGGMIPLLMMELGEVVFGGVGSGLYGILIFAILAVFISGLMIGRTPEYLGKKIEVFEIKMVSISLLVLPLLVLVGTGLALMTTSGTAEILNPGAHGFTEVLYAFSSTAHNNGSDFAGLSTTSAFYQILLSAVMWLGRFGTLIPALAIAGSLAAKKKIPFTTGSLPTHGPLFTGLLIGVIFLVSALTYFPALALGPIVEQITLSMHQWQLP
jgi:potassium-transporting ATPase potassium-binding subunit